MPVPGDDNLGELVSDLADQVRESKSIGRIRKTGLLMLLILFVLGVCALCLISLGVILLFCTVVPLQTLGLNAEGWINSWWPAFMETVGVHIIAIYFLLWPIAVGLVIIGAISDIIWARNSAARVPHS